MHKFRMEELAQMMECDEGGCTTCGAIQGGCEPDAENYRCEECGNRTVHGVMTLLFMK